jgi:hypothetical protein
MEDDGSSLPIRDNSLQFDLGPYQIKTFKLKLQPLKEKQ